MINSQIFGTPDQYISKPCVMDGNPILADDKVLFNDMLGTTLGVKDGDRIMQNNLTAFGESLSASPMQDSFFTGKPHVREMGYVFLFRAYRADQGKWNSQDPVALAMALPTAADFSKNSSFVKALGYPDGWNNLAYVNNNVIDYIDFNGGELEKVHSGNSSESYIWNDAGPYSSRADAVAVINNQVAIMKRNIISNLKASLKEGEVLVMDSWSNNSPIRENGGYFYLVGKLTLSYTYSIWRQKEE